MRIDLTYQLSKEKISAPANTSDSRDKNLISFGHMGTYFNTKGKNFTIHTYPLNIVGFSKIPCRVVAEF